VQHPISKTIEKLENPDGADQIKQIWPRRREAAKGYGQFLPSREEIPGTPRSHSLSSQKIGSATKPLREGPHGMLTHCIEIIGVLATFGIYVRSAPRARAGRFKA
jgi:hypothetical protein